MKTDEKPFLIGGSVITGGTKMASVHPQPEVSGEIQDSPIEQVRNTVPTTDNPTLPTLTIRTWIMGPILNILTSSMLQIFSFKTTPIVITKSIVQFLVLIMGRLMAAKFPKKNVRIPLTKFKFSLNPGPFNVKEHILVSILATTGYEASASIPIVTIIKAFFHGDIELLPTFLLVQTNQMIGYGFTGMFMNFIVNSPYMWFPQTLGEVAFYRALHEKEKRPKGEVSKLQFLMISCVAMFAFSVLTTYYATSLMAFSVVCLIWKNSVKAQIIGSGDKGLGIGAFSLDWGSIMGYIGSPLVYPKFSIINKLVGFFVIMYIIAPYAYFNNYFHAKTFPFFSINLFNSKGGLYDPLQVLGEDLALDLKKYESYSKIQKPAFSIFTSGFAFAGITAALAHFLLFHARDCWNQVRHAVNEKKSRDIHNELMKKYKTIPHWWFYIILMLSFGAAIANCIFYGSTFQLPVWGFLAAILFPILVLLPQRVISATTGMYVSMDKLGEMVLGYASPGKPLSYMTFVAYSRSTNLHASVFLSEFKLAHYMKIPPRSLFIVQIFGALLASTTRIFSAWWVYISVENICEQDIHNIWSCPYDQKFLNDALIWGGVGPGRVYAPHGEYAWLYVFFLIGAMGPIMVYFLRRTFPNQNWIKFIHFPIIFTGPLMMPPMGTAHIWSFFAVGLFFHFVVYKKWRKWWTRHVYDLSNGLDLGTALFSMLCMVTLTLNGIYAVEWAGSTDQCPLATCPTAPGIVKRGCPVV